MKLQEIKASPEQRNNKKTKDKRKFKKRMFLLQLLLIFVLLTATVVMAAMSPLFSINRIEVYGARYCKPSDIENSSNIIIGNNGFKTIATGIMNVLTFRYGEAEASIKKNNPYVKSVVVRYIIPGRMKINIVERSPAALIPYMGSYLVVDNEACTLDMVKKADAYKLPVFNGLKFNRYELGQALQLSDRDGFDKALRLMRVLKSLDKDSSFKIYEKIKNIDISDAGNIKFDYDARITVNIGDLQDMNYRVDFLKEILSKNLGKEDKGYLDLTAENPNFMPDK